jgi:uncharacterized protein
MKKENLYTPDCIRTYSGKYINVFNPNPDDILIEDIAHALSRAPRFGGHLPVPYSVARHSIACCRAVVPHHKLAALLHDGSESLLGDLAKPIKMRMPEYQAVEDKLMRAIARKFGFQYPLHDDVHCIDKTMLHYEWYSVFLKRHGWWARWRFFLRARRDKREFLDLYYKYSHSTA